MSQFVFEEVFTSYTCKWAGCGATFRSQSRVVKYCPAHRKENAKVKWQRRALKRLARQRAAAEQRSAMSEKAKPDALEDDQFTFLDCTCASDPLGRCVVHSDEEAPALVPEPLEYPD
jgi:hypothetical protein